MPPKVKAEAAPAVPEAAEVRDENHGHGGSYIVNADGTRTLQARTELAEAPGAADEPTENKE
ncbi:hypothetical protein [Chitinibacter sp. GC72]|uniref:hypothetical protein n=1 Tax=Chitinibacter sp. GC72 TaxID=1526917 RepID=UPI0012F8BD6A|nr:hypothetical protein [Chitinibacter sp. GC72]